MRDAGALESALGRPKHRWHYRAVDDLAGCAAAYGFGLAKNHAFSDGNKRTAFVSMVTFLEGNGLHFSAPETEAVTTMLGVATGEIDEEALAEWLRANVKKRRR
jgi:death-on-curing protein